MPSLLQRRGGPRRIVRPPDLRHTVKPRLEAHPRPGELDYDDLVVHRSWRAYDEAQPDTCKYFMYELSQRDPFDETGTYHHFYKAVRLLRITRVPRYLRQTQGGEGAKLVFEQERDLLAALREQGVLFLTLIAKSPKLPLVFSWGVQAVAPTPEQAQSAADESYAVLVRQVEGTFQQLEYKPLTLSEGETLARYQSEWRHIAVARGRPLPTGLGHAGASSWLDGNRTAVESTANQLESFIRGMGDRSFLMTLVTTPVAPVEMTVAWRNISKRLSERRSDQQGQRGVSAGLAMPLGFGLADGTQQGGSQALAESAGVSETTGVSQAETLGRTESLAHGENLSVSETQQFTEGQAHTVGESESVGASVTEGVSAGVSESAGVSQQQSVSASQSQSAGASVAETEGATASVSESQQLGVSASESVSQQVSESATAGQTTGVSESAQVSESQSAAQNWSSGVNESASESAGHTVGASESVAESVSQQLGVSSTESSGLTDTEGVTSGSDLRGGVGLLGGGASTAETASVAENIGVSDQLSTSLTGSNTLTEQVSEQMSETLSRSVGVSESVGGSATETVGATQGVGTSASESASQSVSASEGVSSTRGQTASEGIAASHGVTQSLTAGQSLSQSVGVTEGASAGQSQTVGQSQSQSATAGQSASQTTSASQTSSVAATEGRGTTAGVSRTETAGVSQSASQAVSQTAGQSAAQSDTRVAALSQTHQRSGTWSAIPQIAYNISRASFDESSRTLADMIEAQHRRYLEGIESGAFLYQLFLVCEDRETLVGGSGLLKSAFWGTGSRDARLPQPFQTFDSFDEGERQRLLEHAAALTSYRRRESRVELAEPYMYSTIITPQEAAAICHPPTSEALGLLAVHDSMPVFAMPYDRDAREITMGHLVNGERAQVTTQRYGFDVDELSHTLVAGTTGSGKTTTLMRLLGEAVQVRRDVVDVDPSTGQASRTTVPAGALCLDWMSNFRDLKGVVDDDRFQFFSLSNPRLGRFRFNMLAIPHPALAPVEWANTVADLVMITYGLGEYARSIVWQMISELYAANRLEPYTLRPEVRDEETGEVIREAVVLDPVDETTLPPEAVVEGDNGERIANVFSYPELSRLVSMQHLAVRVAAEIEAMADQDRGRLMGFQHRERLQTVWRRLQYFAPGQPLAHMFDADPSLDEHTCLQVRDLVDPERGLVTVIEADGVDLQNRRFVLGGVLMAVWRHGQHAGEGVFNGHGRSPGTFLVIDEAHELLGSQGDDEDRDSAATRVAIYEAMFRRSRALGLRLVASLQNVSQVPSAITSNTSTVFAHTMFHDADRKVIANLMNWERNIGQHFREVRYLGELPVGWAIARLRAKDHFLQAAPVHFVTEPLELPRVTDAELASAAR